MTRDEVLNVASYYNNFVGLNPRFQLQHLVSMYPQMVTMDDTEKLMRWLGFMQGVLWSEMIFTLEELKQHNKYGVNNQENEKNGKH